MSKMNKSDNLTLGFLSTISVLAFFMLFSNLIFVFFRSAFETVLLYNIVCFFLLLAEHIFDALSRQRGARTSSSMARTAILLALLNYASISLLTGTSFPSMFIPNALSISSTIIAPMAALLASSLAMKLHSRQQMNSLVKGADTQHALSDIFASHSSMVINSHKMAKSLRSTSRTLLFLSIVLVIIFSFAGDATPFVITWFLLTVICTLSLMGNAQAYIEEHRFFQFGLASSEDSQKKKQNASLLLILTCLIFSFAASNNKAPLSPALVGQFLASIFSPSRSVTRSDNYLDDYRIETNQYERVIDQTLPGLGTSIKTVPFFENFFVALQYILVFGLLIALLYFLLKPMIAEKLGFVQILKQILLQFLGFIFGPFRLLVAAMRQVGKRKPKKQDLNSGLKSVKPREYIESLIKNAAVEKSKEKKSLARSLMIYLEFLEWLYSKGFRWSLSDTPQEISQNSATFTTASQSQMVEKLANLLERDLFSLNRLDEASLGFMSKLVVDLRTKVDGSSTKRTD